ncbi:cyclic nucleotide-binding domain-containing protein [Asanoa sp. NPDC049573]|uniref:Crp/Fnr family transcriptional regulator n=1 Tax=Asanoa sp. NPDC049573 TaxID=3155396 RepID=UPI00343BD840
MDGLLNAALAGSFLGKLPSPVVDTLVERGETVDFPAGTAIYREHAAPRAWLVVDGLVRVYMTSPQGREVTVRYARPGDVLGIAVLVGGPADVAVQTLALVAHVTQQELADAVGSVREVVARVLREFRQEHLVATRPDSVHILDPAGPHLRHYQSHRQAGPAGAGSGS